MFRFFPIIKVLNLLKEIKAILQGTYLILRKGKIMIENMYFYHFFSVMKIFEKFKHNTNPQCFKG